MLTTACSVSKSEKLPRPCLEFRSPLMLSKLLGDLLHWSEAETTSRTLSGSSRSTTSLVTRVSSPGWYYQLFVLSWTASPAAWPSTGSSYGTQSEIEATDVCLRPTEKDMSIPEMGTPNFREHLPRNKFVFFWLVQRPRCRQRGQDSVGPVWRGRL